MHIQSFFGVAKNLIWEAPFNDYFKRRPPSKNRKSDFLKILEHPRGLELDIPYYHHGFAIEMQREQHRKYIKFFHRDDPNNFIR
ncbi:hypothetical protein RhiirB3_454169 [Rhizophagus irregularis]|nr:hypothetical protein RhiirB3_454169 [Rhizophagus irregularis]